MKKRLRIIFCVCTLLLTVGFGSLALEAGFHPSSYNPALDENVTFEVSQSCVENTMLRYEWDFDGDGSFEVLTEEPLVMHSFTDSGYIEVTLKVVDPGGRAAICRKGILVGEFPMFAVRDLQVEGDGAILVCITLTARSAVFAPGLEEMIPRGWQVEVVDPGVAISRLANRTLEILWMEPIVRGDIRTFTYRLYRSYGTGKSTLSGIISGYAGERVKTFVCGDISLIH